MNQLYVGIDVSSRNNVTYVMKPDGSKHSEFSVANNLPGAKELSFRVCQALDELQLDSVIFGMEATSIYGEHLARALREDGSLGKFNRKIFVINPKQVRKYREILPELPKNDFIDAYVIADSLRFGRILPREYAENNVYESLKTLTRTRLALIQKQADAKQKLANLLFQKCSSLAQDNVFGGISTTFLNLMECFDSVDDLANLSLPELTSFIAGSGRGRFKDPDAIAKAVQAAVRGSYRLPKVMNDSVNQALSLYVSLIQTLKVQIDALDTSIEKHFDIIPNGLKTIPGIGKVYSAGIIAEIGDIGRFDSHASLAKYAGLVWSQHQSGNYEAESTHLIKSGNRYLRYYLLEAANSVRRCDSEFKRYYDLKYKEVNRGQHKRALALTARKLVRLIFRLLKDNRLYSAR